MKRSILPKGVNRLWLLPSRTGGPPFDYVKVGKTEADVVVPNSYVRPQCRTGIIIEGKLYLMNTTPVKCPLPDKLIIPLILFPNELRAVASARIQLSFWERLVFLFTNKF
jgi:hypothetical protein